MRRIVDPNGVAIDFEHGADGNLVAAATDAGGSVARLQRDAAGRVTGAVRPLGWRVALFYDDRGRMVERHDPGGGVWRYEYAAAGRLVSVTDPTGAREEIRYGEHGAAVEGFGETCGGRFYARDVASEPVELLVAGVF